MRLRDVAPNFRCITTGSGTQVEVPSRTGLASGIGKAAISTRTQPPASANCSSIKRQARGRIRRGLAELLDDHRLSKPDG